MNGTNETYWRVSIKLEVGEWVICLFGIFLYIFLLPNFVGLYMTIIAFIGMFIRWFRAYTGKVSDDDRKKKYLSAETIKKWWWVPIVGAGVCFLLIGLDLPFLSGESASLIAGLLCVYLDIECVVLWKVFRSNSEKKIVQLKA